MKKNMKVAKNWKDYEIIATGNGEKLERWKDVYLLRPDPQIIWRPSFELSKFENLNAKYERSSSGGGKWNIKKKFKEVNIVNQRGKIDKIIFGIIFGVISWLFQNRANNKKDEE